MARKSNYEPKQPGENRKILQNAIEALKHPRVDTKDPNAIKERISEYLEFCMKNDVIPSVAACANWLGISVATLQSWYSGATGSPDHQLAAARFYGIMQDVWSQNMQENNVNPVSGIFMGKVFFGYKDTQEIVVSNRAQNELSAADLIAESKMLPGGDNLIIDGEAKILDEIEQLKLPEKESEKPQKEPKKKPNRINTEKN